MLPMFMQKPFDVHYLQHIKRRFGTALIGYWPLDEAAGASTVTDYSGQGNDGTPSNVTFGQGGIGDGRTAASFNGTTSYVDVYSAGLDADFNGDEYTFAIWWKVSSSAVWTDGTQRRMFRIQGNGDVVSARKSVTNNTITFVFQNGGVFVTIDAGQTTTAWTHIAMTGSLSGNSWKAYLGGAQTGSTQG